MMKTPVMTASLAFWVTVAATASSSAERYTEYSGTVIRVIDGDTLEVAVDLWPGLTGAYSVRVRGIDAPEIRRGDCPEREDEMLAWGEDSKAQVEKLYGVGTFVRLEHVAPDAFAGRVVADVRRWRTDRWLSLKDELLNRNLAVEWTPDMDDVPWCLLVDAR